jgi:hypothetical protein
VRRESLQIGQPFEYAAHERELHAINTTAKECRDQRSSFRPSTELPHLCHLSFRNLNILSHYVRIHLQDGKGAGVPSRGGSWNADPRKESGCGAACNERCDPFRNLNILSHYVRIHLPSLLIFLSYRYIVPALFRRRGAEAGTLILARRAGAARPATRDVISRSKSI